MMQVAEGSISSLATFRIASELTQNSDIAILKSDWSKPGVRDCCCVRTEIALSLHRINREAWRRCCRSMGSRR